jgi:hypothetical protein
MAQAAEPSRSAAVPSSGISPGETPGAVENSRTCCSQRLKKDPQSDLPIRCEFDDRSRPFVPPRGERWLPQSPMMVFRKPLFGGHVAKYKLGVANHSTQESFMERSPS